MSVTGPGRTKLRIRAPSRTAKPKPRPKGELSPGRRRAQGLPPRVRGATDRWRSSPCKRGAAILDRGGQRWVAGPHLGSRSRRGPLPPGRRLVAKAQREPVKELLVLAGTGNLTPQGLPEILRFSHCPKS
jgi:hypothetical protein